MARCTFCGPIDDSLTAAIEHLASPEHAMMVRLRAHLDTVIYAPPVEPAWETEHND
jgi:hypothetical protein